MFSERLWRGRSRSLTLLLLAVAVPPAATLVWLGWLLVQQDRALLAQRDFERRQVAAQTAVRSLELSLAAAERVVFAGLVPDGMVRLVLSPDRVDAQPADRVLWLPAMRRAELADDRRFADAERLEFQGGVDRALAIYEDAARSPKPDVRAGALLRLARVRRSQTRWDDALTAYRRLSTIHDVAIAGAPADLQARRGSGAVLQAANRTQELAREARALAVDLLTGRWTLDRAAWELTAADIERWTGEQVPVAADRRMFSTVAAMLSAAHPPESSARRLLVVDGTWVTVLWQAEGDRAAALAISPTVLHAWVRGALDDGPGAGAHLSLLGPTGELLAGPAVKPGAPVVKTSASETGLPWTIVLGPGDSSSASADVAGRQRLMSAGLAAILLLLAGGSYFLWRVMQRELAVARLQTDFVAAVSHEFRTPLTSLRQVAELLEEHDDMPLARRRTFYEALGRNTERLHRLVESLLDFARMESHRKPYNLQSVDAAALVADVVAEFQKEVAGRFTIALAIETPASARLRADAVSLNNALWNLLDNAVKYSPDRRSVYVAVRQHRDGIAISVRDEGLGVPIRERKEIFGRFVRGETASRLGIKGTGLGLAMVSHIVEAHRGKIELESEERVGSTFTIVLPEASFTENAPNTRAQSFDAEGSPSASSGSSAFES